MAVTHTSDEHLLLEVFKHRSVILKYHTDDCGKICQELLPVYEKLSDEKENANIVFLRIDAGDNPVAKEFIMKKKQPIISIYHKGRLLESTYVSTPDKMLALIKILQDINQKEETV